MPQALEIDHNEVRVIALQIGVREAARQLGLEEDTVKSWSLREQWFAHRALTDSKIQAAVEQKRVSQGLSPVAPTAVKVLEDYGKPTRLNHAKAAHKISVKVAEMDPDELFLTVPNVLAAAKHAAVVHGWSGTSVNVGIRLDEIAKMQLSVDLPQEIEETES